MLVKPNIPKIWPMKHRVKLMEEHVDALMMGGFFLILEDGIPLIQTILKKQSVNKSYLDCVKHLVQGTILLTKHNGISVHCWHFKKIK